MKFYKIVNEKNYNEMIYLLEYVQEFNISEKTKKEIETLLLKLSLESKALMICDD